MKSSTSFSKTNVPRKIVWLLWFSGLMLTLAFVALLAQDVKARAWLASFAHERAADGSWLVLPLLATMVSFMLVWMYRIGAQHQVSLRGVRVALFGGLLAVVGLATLYVAPVALGHNLDSGFVYMYFDPATQAAFDARIAVNLPGTPLLQNNDIVGMMIKVVPNSGTTTGVGGYVDFYVPNGVQVLDAAYMVPDGSGGLTRAAMKGQSPIAIGDGPIGTNCTAALASGGPLTLGPNINGVTAQAVVTTTGCHNGTIAGVYGDTGIFYSTDPRTAYDTFRSIGGGGVLKNNSGDSVGARTSVGTVPNLWDAQQLAAYGISGSTNPNFAGSPIVDPNGRGNAPWGNANAVAGPQSGYAWEFNKTNWDASIKDAAAMKAASSVVGPWNRIKYPGSQVSLDQPGLKSTVLGFASKDASQLGFTLSPGTPLTTTVSQTDATSPKTIRWSVGQLTYLKPEYVWVQFKVIDRTQLATAQGGACPVFNGDTFGGDAGGTDNGKDHIWRYYDPNGVSWNACMGGGKPDNVGAAKVGDLVQFKVQLYNYGLTPLTHVVAKDTLPSGVTFVGASPAQSSGPNPLQWNIGTIPVGGKFQSIVTVKVTGSGALNNTLLFTSDQVTQTVNDIVPSGAIPILNQTKVVNPATVSPGATVQYTMTINNVGSGPTGSPVQITEYLPTGFTFVSKDKVTANGADVTTLTTVNTTNTNQPVFSIPSALNAGQSIIVRFTALVPANAATGSYCNSFSTMQNGIPETTGALACVTVGGGQIGDTIFRDWNGNGIQDPQDEGLPGVTVQLNTGATAVTDANGKYLFTGLTAGTYTVTVGSGVPAGYTQTADPNGPPLSNSFSVALATNQQNLTVDFGYKPGGTGTIGDLVFQDKNNNGVFDGTDVGITATVTVYLYEDTNNNGVIDPLTDAKVMTATTNASGVYSFTNLATGMNYLVDVDQTDTDLINYFSPNAFVSTTPDPGRVTNLTGSYLNADFGFFKNLPGSIGDMVCRDTNSDGLCTATDTGIPNVTVWLYRDMNADGNPNPADLVITATTSITGYYSFTGLGPDNYIVVVDTNDPDLADGYTTLASQIPVTLAAAQNVSTADFPFTPLISKQVSKANANPSDTLSYTTTVNYLGNDLFETVRVRDPLPAGTTYVTGSANMSGTFGIFVSADDQPAVDDQGAFSTGMTMAVTPTVIAINGTVTVTMQLTTTQTITNVTPLLPDINGGNGTCTAPTPASQNVVAGTPSTFTFRCTLTTQGEFTFDGTASGALGYDFPGATSNSMLVSKTGSAYVVTWPLGSSVPGTPGVVILTGSLPGIYAFEGNNTAPFWRYGTVLNSWTTKANYSANVKMGGALAYDGTYIYGFQGNGKQVFSRYDIVANTWTARASTGTNVTSGGALVYLRVHPKTR